MESVELHLRSDVPRRPVSFRRHRQHDAARLPRPPQTPADRLHRRLRRPRRRRRAPRGRAPGQIRRRRPRNGRRNGSRNIPPSAGDRRLHGRPPRADYAIIPRLVFSPAAHARMSRSCSPRGRRRIFRRLRPLPLRRPPLVARRPPHARARHLLGLDVLWNDLPDWRNNWAALEGAAQPRHSRLQAAQAADIAEWLPNDLLLKLDRCLMAHASKAAPRCSTAPSPAPPSGFPTT